MTAPLRSKAKVTSPGGQAAKVAKCPVCGKPADPVYRPFCSKRCSDVDLGRWLGGRYAIPGEEIGARSDEEDE